MAGKGSTVGKAIVVIDDDETQSGATKGSIARRSSRPHSSPAASGSVLQKHSKIVSLEAHRPTGQNPCNNTQGPSSAVDPSVRPASLIGRTFLTANPSLPSNSGPQEPLSNFKRFGVAETTSAAKPVSEEGSWTKSTTTTQPNGATRRSLAEDIIEDDNEDFSQSEEDLREWLAQQSRIEARRISAASTNNPANGRKSSIVRPRNMPVVSPFSFLENASHKGIVLHPNSTVELEDEDFLRIVEIIQDASTSEITLRGWRFRRSKFMNGLLERKLNELCWILHVDKDDTRNVNVQGMDTVSVMEVKKRRRLRITNQLFPALSWREDSGKDTDETVYNDRVLVCRWKYICFYPDARARECCDHIENELSQVRADECDKGLDNEIADSEIRKGWRGHTIEGGSQAGWLPGEKEFLRQEDLSHNGIQSRSSLKQSPDRDFPMGDPMERGCVGYLLDVSDLQVKIATVCKSHLKPDVLSLPGAVAPKQHIQASKISFSLPIDPIIISDEEPDSEESDSGHRRVLELKENAQDSSSLRTIRSHRMAPQIVEMNAQIKTSTISGIFESTYKGRMTSTFSPAPIDNKRKGATAEVLDCNTRPGKRADSGCRTPSRLDLSNSYIQHSPSSPDSSVILGRPQSPEAIQETRTPRVSSSVVKEDRGLFTSECYGRGNPTRLGHSDKTKLPTLQPSPEEQLWTEQFNERSQPPVHHSPRTGIFSPGGTVIDLTAPQPKSFVSDARGKGFAIFEQRPESDFSVSGRQSNAFGNFPTNDLTPGKTPSKHGSNLVSTPLKLNEIKSTPSSAHPNMAIPLPLSSRSTYPPARVVIAGQRSKAASQKDLTSKGVMNVGSDHQVLLRRYTLVDSFCGAGGMSRGAVMAGIRVKCAFDFNASACESYAMNNFGTAIYNVWADQFTGSTGDYKADILHLSPPCQFFSDAHTIQGKDDEMNTASLFAIGELLEKVKPRVVTLEQTAGLLRRHRTFFNAAVRMFTNRGFSMRWRLLNCADFGLPQRRLRLFIIASCPGETLPPIPTPTHSEFPTRTGLKPWTTINAALASIPPTWPDHSPPTAIPRTAPPKSGDQIVTCVTTSGGGIIHPSGTRDLTNREFASLQGFPLGHKFSTTGVKKQIGNAVPPLVAKMIFEEVKKGLMRADGLLL